MVHDYFISSVHYKMKASVTSVEITVESLGFDEQGGTRSHPIDARVADEVYECEGVFSF